MNRAFLKIRTLVASALDRQRSLGCNTRATRAGAEVRRAVAGFGPGSVDEADGRQADARRRAAQQGECGVRRSSSSATGAGTRRSKPSTCCIPRSSSTVWSWWRRRVTSRRSRSRRSTGDATSTQTDGAAAVSRVRRRRRCDCAAGLRELRHARRLQGARPTRHRREGQDRHRPLRRRLARTEAEARAGARRGRLPHLFRSARGRLLRRRRVSEGRLRARRKACSAARCSICRSRRAIRSRPASARRKKAKRLTLEQAKTILKIPVMPISYARCAAAARGARRAGRSVELARRAADHVSHRPRSGESAPVDPIRLEPQAGVQRDRENSRRASAPTNGSCAATIATAGCSARGDPLSGHVAMMAEAKAIGALLKQGWRPKRTLVYASWDAEEPGLLGSVGMGRRARGRSCRARPCCTSTRTATRAGSSRRPAVTRCSGWSTRSRSDVKDPQTGVSVKQRLDARSMVNGYDKDASSTREGSGEAARERARTSRSTRSARARTSRRSCSTSGSPR